MTSSLEATGSGGSAVERAAQKLREEILERGDGELLGSEDELMKRIGVSRPTLRQTARLLEHEQLLSVRRGVKGGYYARTPDTGAIAHVAALYLRARGATLGELFIAARPLCEAAYQRAAVSSDTMKRARLQESLSRHAKPDDAPSAGRMLADEVEFIERVLDLADNSAIELFLRVLYQFGLNQTTARLFANQPDRIREWIAARVRVAAAIVAQDPEIAVLASRRQRDLIQGWLTEDLGPRAGDLAAGDGQASESR